MRERRRTSRRLDVRPLAALNSTAPGVCTGHLPRCVQRRPAPSQPGPRSGLARQTADDQIQELLGEGSDPPERLPNLWIPEALRSRVDHRGNQPGIDRAERPTSIPCRISTSICFTRAAIPSPPNPWPCWEANTRRACDLLDGVADGLVGDPHKCTVELLELDALECQGGPAPDCLTAGQIETARFVYTGITAESGAVVTPGVYPGGELGGDFELWVTGPVPFIEGTASDITVEVLEAAMHRTPGFGLDTFDPVKDLPELKDAVEYGTMTVRLYSEEELDRLRVSPKRVTNPGSRWSDKPSGTPIHRQRSFKATGEDAARSRFDIYQRQSLQDEADFSSGIALVSVDGSRLTLARYNGPSHEHGAIRYRPHIHRANAKTIATGGKPERHAEETDRFITLEGVFACLLEDFNVVGVSAAHDAQRDLPL